MSDSLVLEEKEKKFVDCRYIPFIMVKMYIPSLCSKEIYKQFQFLYSVDFLWIVHLLLPLFRTPSKVCLFFCYFSFPYTVIKSFVFRITRFQVFDCRISTQGSLSFLVLPRTQLITVRPYVLTPFYFRFSVYCSPSPETTVNSESWSRRLLSYEEGHRTPSGNRAFLLVLIVVTHNPSVSRSWSPRG